MRPEDSSHDIAPCGSDLIAERFEAHLREQECDVGARDGPGGSRSENAGGECRANTRRDPGRAGGRHEAARTGKVRAA